MHMVVFNSELRQDATQHKPTYTFRDAPLTVKLTTKTKLNFDCVSRFENWSGLYLFTIEPKPASCFNCQCQWRWLLVSIASLVTVIIFIDYPNLATKLAAWVCFTMMYQAQNYIAQSIMARDQEMRYFQHVGFNVANYSVEWRCQVFSSYCSKHFTSKFAIKFMFAIVSCDGAQINCFVIGTNL